MEEHRTYKPFEAGELRAAALRPDLMIDLLLAQWPRLSCNVQQGQHLKRLIALLLGATIISSLPYAAVLDPQALEKIALLYLGAVAICFPSLHIFSAFLGLRSGLLQDLLVALIQAAVSSLFTLGFAPVLWFLGLTMGGAEETSSALSAFFLSASALAGLLHFFRCAYAAQGSKDQGRRFALLGLWQLLLIFIGVQMAQLIGLI